MDKVLIVDDDRDLRAVVRDVLRDEGFATIEAGNGLDALKLFRADMPDAVLLDLNMPYMNGIETLQELRKLDRHVPVIMITAFGDIPTAVEAIRNGAYDFTVKPPEFDRLIITLRRAIERRALETAVERMSTEVKLSLEHLLGKSRAMKTVIDQIRQVAHTDFSVILQGETGTGKSVIAGAIHNLSRRADRTLVSVDIGLIPDHLVESELFGYRKGAFTGADRDKTGYLETAHRGTIFIDEMENMSSLVQSKLLSFIEKKKIYPLGGTSPVDVDIRLIGATNRDIRDSVRRKEFREDLFYRIGEFIISLPPLRERVEDIPFFANKFVLEASSELNKQIRGISDDAVDLLLRHSWPGNLRELKNCMRKACLVTEGDIISKDCLKRLLAEECKSTCAGTFDSLKDTVKDFERKIILEALAKTEGNRTKAAEALRISSRTLFDKIKEYGID